LRQLIHKRDHIKYDKWIFFFLAGFIIVAACVMTFEARDSAAKVGPAGQFRFHFRNSYCNFMTLMIVKTEMTEK